MVLGA